MQNNINIWWGKCWISMGPLEKRNQENIVLKKPNALKIH